MTRAFALAVLLLSGVSSTLAKEPPPPGLCETAATTPSAPPYIGILSAFPAELAPLVAALDHDETVEVDGQPFHVGRLDGVNVVLGLLGIGLLNAEAATVRMLSHFEIAAVIVSGVAGSAHNIGDVVIAAGWLERDLERVLRPNKALMAIAEGAPAHLPAPFDTCTPVPPDDPEAPLVCMPHTPQLHFEPLGQSDDPFGDTPLPCTPGAGEIFGCELPSPAAAFVGTAAAKKEPAIVDVQDMETAAVCRIATEQRIPFIGVRGVSDGAGDPLGDRGFPAQFFDYYKLAAINAALVTRGIVGQIGAYAVDPEAAKLCKRLDKRKWRSAARLIRSAS
jgi:nucleoside phosphorylase